MQVRNRQDFWAGVLFVVVGIFFMIFSQQYTMGTAAKMGPGYFPTVLGGLMALLGLILAFSAIRSGAAKTVLAKVGWRELVLILVAVALYAALLPKMGIIVAIIVLIFVASFASHEFSVKSTLITTLFLLVMSYLVFVKGLELQFPLLPYFMTK